MLSILTAMVLCISFSLKLKFSIEQGNVLVYIVYKLSEYEVIVGKRKGRV